MTPGGWAPSKKAMDSEGHAPAWPSLVSRGSPRRSPALRQRPLTRDSTFIDLQRMVARVFGEGNRCGKVCYVAPREAYRGLTWVVMGGTF